jgi:hypothetical protein
MVKGDSLCAVVSDCQGCTYNYSTKEIELVCSTRQEAESALENLLPKRIEKMRDDMRAYERSLDTLLNGTGGRIKRNDSNTFVMCS